MGLRITPFAFTDYGVLMLSSVLNSERATQINILIIRVFTKMRELLLTHKDILLKLEKLERQYTEHDDKIILVFEYLKQLESSRHQELVQRKRRKVGFKPK